MGFKSHEIAPANTLVPRREKLQWHKYQERDPAILWLRSLLRETAQSLPAVEASGASRLSSQQSPPRKRRAK